MARKHDHTVACDSSLSTNTSGAELAYQQSQTAIALLDKDEKARKLRIQIQSLRNDIDDLNEKLWEEQERGEEAEVDAENWQSRAHDVVADLDRASADLRSKTNELETTRAELLSLQGVSSDSTKILTQKLALERELANIKPELEHLRSTTTSNQGLLSEKLSLERKLGTVQIELESATLAVQQARARKGKANEQDSELEAEIADLQRQLAKAHRDFARADKRSDAEDAKRVKELERQLAKETRERERAEKAALSNDSSSEAHEAFQTQLDAEKRHRQKLERDFKKAQQTWDAEKAVLDDKLSQFRTKLRSTKEKLKEAETELVEVRSGAAVVHAAKNDRKRSAAQLDPDAAIGTPGDAPNAKRTKRATSIFGEKSNFSITPFLNKQTSVVPEGPATDAEDEPIASIEDTASPSVTAAAKKQTHVLADASPGKSNPKIKAPARKKTATKISLVSVPEEEEENAPESTETVIAPQPAFSKKAKLTLKPRKTLDSFASFREASLPPQPLQQKKTRKLGGGAKTLFDDDDDDDAIAPAGPKGLGGQRAFGAFGSGFGGGLKRLGALGGKSKSKSLMVADGGFTFSPLKRNPRAGSVQPGV